MQSVFGRRRKANDQAPRFTSIQGSASHLPSLWLHLKLREILLHFATVLLRGLGVVGPRPACEDAVVGVVMEAQRITSYRCRLARRYSLYPADLGKRTPLSPPLRDIGVCNRTQP